MNNVALFGEVNWIIIIQRMSVMIYQCALDDQNPYTATLILIFALFYILFIPFIYTCFYITVRSSREPGWIEGNLNGKTGLVPLNYVEFL